MAIPSVAAPPLGVEEARRRLPELLERAAGGEEFVIQRHKKPMAALVPLGGQAPTDPLKRQRQIQSLMSLQGSGRSTWDPNQRHPATPAPAAPAISAQPSDHFRPSQLVQGSRIALDGTALVAFLADAKGTGKYLQPLMQGIAQGTWQGVISSVSLARVMEGPWRRGMRCWRSGMPPPSPTRSNGCSCLPMGPWWSPQRGCSARNPNSMRSEPSSWPPPLPPKPPC